MIQEDTLFHEALSDSVIASDGDSLRAIPCRNLAMQYSMAESFAIAAGQMLVSVEDSLRREEQSSLMQRQGRNDRQSTVYISMNKRAACFRAERDLWRLLGCLTRADLLRDISEQQEGFGFISACSSVKEVITAAYASNENIRKGKILQDWSESAAADRVILPPSSGRAPFKNTLSRMLKSKSTAVKSMHPDAQISRTGVILPYDSADNVEQESLLKCIWQLIRCGDITRAQEIAAEHNMYYLSASLLGVAHGYYTTDSTPVDSDEMMERIEADEIQIGNFNRLQWVSTCSKYAEHLSKCTENWKQNTESSLMSSVAILEMSIFASLSNNTSVLSRSPLVSSWSDKLWMHIKTLHERDVACVLQKYHQVKFSHSKLFIPNSELAFSCEQRFISEQGAFLSGVGTGDCSSLMSLLPRLNTAPPLFVTPSKTSLHLNEMTEELLFQLQSCVVCGPSAIADYITSVINPLVLASNLSSYLSRVYALFIIWLYLSCPEQEHLLTLIDASTLNSVVGLYVDSLMASSHKSAVATFASLIDRSLRIDKYIKWMNDMSSHAVQSTDGDPALVLASAKRFFKDDILDITRGAVLGAKEKSSMVSSAVSTANSLIPASPVAPPMSHTGAIVPYSNREVALRRDSEIIHDELFASDIKKAESLRWLCIDLEHRNEVLQQVNSFIVHFMLESKGEKHKMIGRLLNEFLPPDAIEVGTENIEMRHSREQSADNRNLDQQSLAFNRNQLKRLDEKVHWLAEVNKIKSWWIITAALDAEEAWTQCRTLFRRTKAMLLGDHTTLRSSMVSKCFDIEQSADYAILAILNALCNRDERDSKEKSRPSSLIAVWKASEVALLNKIDVLLGKIDTEEILSDREDRSFEYELMRAYVDSLKQTESIEVRRVLNKISQVCDKHISAGCSSNVQSLLATLNLHLKVLSEEKQILTLTLHMLCERYLMICMETAEALLDILLPQVKSNYLIVDNIYDDESVSRVMKWLVRVIDFAEVIGDEDMGIYRFMDKDSVAQVLSFIKSASVISLHLSPDFLI